MAINENFTQFATGTIGTSSVVVGYDTVLNAEAQYTWPSIVSYLGSNLAFAPIASPDLTGTPTAPTPSFGDKSTRLATTAWAWGNGLVTANILAINSSTTLTVGNLGSLINISGTFITVTLPTGSSVANGRSIYLINTGSAAATIITQGSDTISIGGSAINSVQLNPGESLWLNGTATTSFLAMGGSVVTRYVPGLAFTSRPIFNGNSPWDTGNLPIIGGRLLNTPAIVTNIGPNTIPMPTGTNFIIIEGCGGGGGAGGSGSCAIGQVSAGTGGNSGNYAKFLVYPESATSLSINIGVAGTGGDSSGTTTSNGQSGGTTTITDASSSWTVTIPGGAGGMAGVPNGSQYIIGTSSNGSTTYTGVTEVLEDIVGRKPAAWSLNSSIANVASGNGADSRWGSGGDGILTTTTAPGHNASGYGAGGSGAAVNSGQVGNTGGNGTPGKAIVYFYAMQ